MFHNTVFLLPSSPRSFLKFISQLSLGGLKKRKEELDSVCAHSLTLKLGEQSLLCGEKIWSG